MHAVLSNRLRGINNVSRREDGQYGKIIRAAGADRTKMTLHAFDHAQVCAFHQSPAALMIA